MLNDQPLEVKLASLPRLHDKVVHISPAGDPWGLLLHFFFLSPHPRRPPSDPKPGKRLWKASFSL